MRQVFRKFFKATGIGAAKAVDGLVRIADHEKPFAAPAPGPDQAVLQAAHILKLVYQQMGGTGQDFTAGRFIALKDAQEDVVKIQQAVLRKLGLVCAQDCIRDVSCIAVFCF